MTAACVEALYKYTDNFRLTVVDDSTDLTEEYFTRLAREWDNINYIRPTEKLRCHPHLVNIGIRATQSDPFVYMGNSTVVEPDWLPILLGAMRDMPSCGIVGPKIIDGRKRLIENAGMYFFEPMEHHLNNGLDNPPHYFTYWADVAGICFTCAVLRRSALPPDGLEEDYYCSGFQGMEDMDYSLDLKKRNWKVVYCGLSSVYHYSYATRGAPSERTREQQSRYVENRIRFLQRWAPWGENTIRHLRRWQEIEGVPLEAD